MDKIEGQTKRPSEAVVNFHSMPRQIDALKVEDTVEFLTTGEHNGRNAETRFKLLVDRYKDGHLDFNELVVCMQRVFRPIHGGGDR